MEQALKPSADPFCKPCSIGGIIESGWHVSAGTLYPSHAFISSVNSWHADNVLDDPALRFDFLSSPIHPPVFIHRSRLTWAGGPLAALAHADFAEKSSNTVKLSDKDPPHVFMIIRDYLYLKTIPIQAKDLRTIVQTLKAANRWQLTGLFRVLCESIRSNGYLTSPSAILTVKDILGFPSLKSSFLSYFWDKVATYFDSFTTAPGPQKPPLLRFPDLWTLAASHNVTFSLMQTILARNRPKTDLHRQLFELTLFRLEPMIKDDSAVLDLMQLLLPGLEDVDCLLRQPSISKSASPRALLLLSRSLALGTHFKEAFSFSHSFVYGESLKEVFTFYVMSDSVNYSGYCRIDCDVTLNMEPKDDSICVTLRGRQGGAYQNYKARIVVDYSKCVCKDVQDIPDGHKSHHISKWITLNPDAESRLCAEKVNTASFVKRHMDSRECELKISCRVHISPDENRVDMDRDVKTYLTDEDIDEDNY